MQITKEQFGKQEVFELSYIDLLSGLEADIQSDIISEEDKQETLTLLHKLQEKLFPYSA